MEVIAHRYGNNVGALRRALGHADVIEIDVHHHRGHIEVRHAKRVWLSSRHWERWFLLPADSTFPDFTEILSAAPPDTSFWIDCKGPDPRLADAIMTIVEPERPITVSSKAWWVLRRFGDRPRTRVIRSVGNRFELILLRLVRSRARLDGVVVHQRLLDEKRVSNLVGRYGAVFTWAVTDRNRAEALRSWGVSGVILDDLELIEELAAARPGSD